MEFFTVELTEEEIAEIADSFEWGNFTCEITDHSEEFMDRFKDKIMCYKLNGKHHSYKDRPSITHQTGTKEWHKNGVLHRDGDKPAHISRDGSQQWFMHGERHRDGDKPAVLNSSGTKIWCKHGIVYFPHEQ